LKSATAQHFEELTNGTYVAFHKASVASAKPKGTKRRSRHGMATVYRTIVRILRNGCSKVLASIVPSRSDLRNGGSVMKEDGTSIRVRIDDQGYTHVTVIQWDEEGQQIVYREDENFQCSETQS
jgi:hypothetical protein